MGAKFCSECGMQQILIPGQELKKPQPKPPNTKYIPITHTSIQTKETIRENTRKEKKRKY
jgi:hypothetical protein